jgi:hypothetical protein
MDMEEATEASVRARKWLCSSGIIESQGQAPQMLNLYFQYCWSPSLCPGQNTSRSPHFEQSSRQVVSNFDMAHS